MKKIFVGNGEIIDKYTILLIKLDKIDEPDKRINVNNELTYLRDDIKELISNFDIEDNINHLKSINLKLWDIEDQLRDLEKKKEFGSKFIELARSVYITNDERSRIKKKINIATNSNIIEKKSYKDY